jgi:L-asparaginase / beta-aspartyl-peptidase
MKNIFFLILIACLTLTGFAQQDYAIVIHGGAGVMSKQAMSKQQQAEYEAKLEEALTAGEKLLKKGATAADAVVEAIRIMEDSPLFNAGKGAVFTSEGKNELDASIMEGKTLNAGAVARVTDIKNPILAARKVMENSEHVLLSSKGASEFAQKQGLEMVQNKYFFTAARFESLKQLQKKERKRTPSDNTGTVGCVALDKYGNLCAGTSTGGMTNKKYGRIGDSPIIGAGNYANNQTCAVSCTGHGEFFIRLAVAKDISAMMEYKNVSVQEASREAIIKLGDLGGTGGVIALDTKGNVAMEFNTGGMFRGYIKSTGEKEIAIFSNE